MNDVETDAAQRLLQAQQTAARANREGLELLEAASYAAGAAAADELTELARASGGACRAPVSREHDWWIVAHAHTAQLGDLGSERLAVLEALSARDFAGVVKAVKHAPRWPAETGLLGCQIAARYHLTGPWARAMRMLLHGQTIELPDVLEEGLQRA